jgi:FtsP/CotA-like multicopper oxidase with cupredoxin domain
MRKRPANSWMYHCHILEHHAAGMVAHFEVVNDAVCNDVVKEQP